MARNVRAQQKILHSYLSQSQLTKCDRKVLSLSLILSCIGGFHKLKDTEGRTNTHQLALRCYLMDQNVERLVQTEAALQKVPNP